MSTKTEATHDNREKQNEKRQTGDDVKYVTGQWFVVVVVVTSGAAFRCGMVCCGMLCGMTCCGMLCGMTCCDMTCCGTWCGAFPEKTSTEIIEI